MYTARLLIIGTVSAVAVGLMAAPASAAPNDDTTVTFTITGGTLDILAPAAAELNPVDVPPVATGTVITGTIGPVTVTDGRAAAVGTWAATVGSTDFITGAGGTAATTVTADNVDYWSGPATATTGGTGADFTPGQPTTGDAEPLGPVVPGPPVVGPVTAFTHTAGTGNNTATWNPSLNVRVPLANVGGVYTGTVTHSVA